MCIANVNTCFLLCVNPRIFSCMYFVQNKKQSNWDKKDSLKYVHTRLIQHHNNACIHYKHR